MRQRLKDFSTLNATVIVLWLLLTTLQIIKHDASCTFLCKEFDSCSFSMLNCFWKAGIPALYTLVLANIGWLVAMVIKRLRQE